MRLRSTARVLVLLFVLLPSQTFAQRQRLYAHVDTTLFELDTDPARLGAVLRSWSPPAPRYTRFVPLAGGRYLAWVDGGLKVFDLVTASASQIFVSVDYLDIVGVDAEGREVTLVERDFLIGGRHTLFVIDDTLKVRRVELPAGSTTFRYAYASDARLLFVLRGIGSCGFLVPCSQWIDIVNLADGTIREQAFAVPYGSLQQIATNGAGTRLWVSTAFDGFAAPAGYGVFDVATGRLIALNTSLRPTPFRYNQPNYANLFVDARSNAILTVTRDGLVALHAETLHQVGSADAPKYRLDDSQIPFPYMGGFGWDVMWHPDAAAIYAFERSWYQYGDPTPTVICQQSALIALDPRTGDRLATQNLVGPNGTPVCFFVPVMTVAPAAPQNVAASVSGRQVTLTWDRPPGTTHYELEVGSAPGLRDLVRTTVSSVSISAEAVPAGTYYVRVRALNYAGKGAYSREIRVSVP